MDSKEGVVEIKAKVVIGNREFPLVKNGKSKTGNWEYWKLGSWGNYKEGVEPQGDVRVSLAVDADLYAEIEDELECGPYMKSGMKKKEDGKK